SPGDGQGPGSSESKGRKPQDLSTVRHGGKFRDGSRIMSGNDAVRRVEVETGIRVQARSRAGARRQKSALPTSSPSQNAGLTCSVFGFDPLAVGYFALVHPQAEATFRISADPCLENNRSAFLPVIRKWYQCPVVALLALRQLHRPRPPSRRPPGPYHE